MDEIKPKKVQLIGHSKGGYALKVRGEQRYVAAIGGQVCFAITREEALKFRTVRDAIDAVVLCREIMWD